MSNFLVVLCLLFSITVSAQRASWKRAGRAEKVWVLSHPFVAKKAFRVTQRVLEVMDSLKKASYFKGNTRSGSKADAVRHAYWMARLTTTIGKRRALKLGEAHEKKNKKDFENGILEEQLLPDQAAMCMDLKNNKAGSELAELSTPMLELVLKALKNGELYWIKQNDNGAFLDENNEVIPLEEWSGKWKNKRVLVPTNL
jgi:hypothetical protein